MDWTGEESQNPECQGKTLQSLSALLSMKTVRVRTLHFFLLACQF